MKIEDLFLKSCEFAKCHPKWWGLAFLQIVSLGWLLKIFRLNFFLNPYFLGLILALILIVSLATVFLWVDILEKNNFKDLDFKYFSLILANCLSLNTSEYIRLKGLYVLVVTSLPSLCCL